MSREAPEPPWAWASAAEAIPRARSKAPQVKPTGSGEEGSVASR